MPTAAIGFEEEQLTFRGVRNFGFSNLRDRPGLRTAAEIPSGDKDESATENSESRESFVKNHDAKNRADQRLKVEKDSGASSRYARESPIPKEVCSGGGENSLGDHREPHAQ